MSNGHVPGGAGAAPWDRGRAPAALALIVYFGVFWILILLPFDFHTPRFRARGAAAPDPAAEAEEPKVVAVSSLKTLGHAVLFLPFGPLLAWWAAMPARRLLGPRGAVPAILMAGFSELSQLTVSRGTSWSDFIMNVLGYAAGAALAISFERSGRARSLVRSATSPGILLPALGAAAAGAFILLLPARGLPFGPRDLEGWDPSYPFLVGNEPTRSRPWHGALERFAVHDRALAPADLLDPLARPRPVVSYRLDAESLAPGAGGQVDEVRPATGPVLRAGQGSEILALPGGGIELRGARSFLEGGDPAAVEAIRKAGEVSIEARFRVEDLGQHGPARIVSCSINNVRRNFTLGQDLALLELRVRTPLTGPNGSLQTLRVEGCLAPGRWIDALATYRRGNLTLYVDGAPRGRLRLCLLGWLLSVAFGAGLTPLMASAVAFVGWAAAFALLWVALERLGRARWRSILCATIGAAALVLLLAGSAAAGEPPAGPRVPQVPSSPLEAAPGQG